MYFTLLPGHYSQLVGPNEYNRYIVLSLNNSKRSDHLVKGSFRPATPQLVSTNSSLNPTYSWVRMSDA
jgi:hypothetical protein